MLGLSDPGLDAAERMGVADDCGPPATCRSRLVYVTGTGGSGSRIDGPAIDGWSATGEFNLMRGDIERVLHDRVRERWRSASARR